MQKPEVMLYVRTTSLLMVKYSEVTSKIQCIDSVTPIHISEEP